MSNMTEALLTTTVAAAMPFRGAMSALSTSTGTCGTNMAYGYFTSFVFLSSFLVSFILL